VTTVKRGPLWGERAIVHVTLNSGHKQRFALVDDNYDPSVLAQLKAALPRVPSLTGWEIVQRLDPKNFGFWVCIRGEAVSNNGVSRAGDTLFVESTLLSASARLSAKEESILADLEQCIAVLMSHA
jgi:hypothetical protein